MATIINAPPEVRIYHGNKDYQVTDHDLMIDNGSAMDKDIESNFGDLAKSATRFLQTKKPITHWKTKNKSFLRLYNDLHRMGIKNNRFFLALYDTDLMAIDPYSPVLPVDLQLKIFLECLINPWYYLREIARVPEDGSPIEIGGGTQYSIDRNNAACWYLYLNGLDHYQSKPRQRGKTVDCVARCNYAYHFGALATSILFFNKDQQMAKLNLYRLKCQRDMLPAWMQMRMIVTEDGKIDRGQDSVTTMRNPVTGNSITVMARATSKDSAMKLGRGATAAIQYYDEFDFMPFNTEIINAASFAYSRASENAKKNSSLYGRIYSSTPGDLDSRDGENATKYINNMLKWDDHMFDEPISKIRAAACGPGRNRVVYVEHNWKQLKCSVQWFEEQCGLVSFEEEVIMREINLKRIHGSNQSPFRRQDIMYLINHKKEPLSEIDLSNNLCPIKMYERLNRDIAYILTMDPSEGLSQDNNAVCWINPYTLKIAAEFKSPYISQPDAVDMCIKFMDKFCPRCLIVVENNRGREAINCFLRSKYRYQLYYDDGKLTALKVDTTDKYGQLKQKAAERQAYGFATTSNRSRLYAILENLVTERKEILESDYLVDDICGLIRKPNGRVEAGPGKHDDNVMAYLIGIFIYLNADAEYLEGFGIVRGASEPPKIYTDEGELTDEAKIDSIKKMLPNMPPELQSMFLEVVKQKDPVREANDYAKELQRLRFERQILPSEMTFVDKLREAQGIGHTADPADQAFWDDYDRSMLDMNDRPLINPGVDLDAFMGEIDY